MKKENVSTLFINAIHSPVISSETNWKNPETTGTRKLKEPENNPFIKALNSEKSSQQAIRKPPDLYGN